MGAAPDLARNDRSRLPAQVGNPDAEDTILALLQNTLRGASAGARLAASRTSRPYLRILPLHERCFVRVSDDFERIHTFIDVLHPVRLTRFIATKELPVRGEDEH